MENMRHLGAIIIAGGVLGYFCWIIYHLIKAVLNQYKRNK